ncbi:cytochrome C [bacterium]|nr:MAG: cytochrome C [bacterium]RIK62625.1 MAG: cytochrome C [Planctomycetota bacterium]
MVVFFTWLSFRQAFRNDRIIKRLEANPALAAKHHRKWEPYHKSWAKRLHVWPYLLRIELVGCLALFTFLLIWSIFLNAPLEEPANPAFTPNPSKAPWYFLGLQELLVYFDPWIAGVVLPGMIISGLMAIPYVDLNPYGNGYYTWTQRKFAITVFQFGWIVLWVALIILGTYIRGPGWQLFLPWEYWDPHRVIFEVNVDASELIAHWLNKPEWALAPTTGPYLARLLHPATVIGGVVTLGMLGVIGGAMIGFFKWYMPEMWKKLGFIRQQVILGHLVIMVLVVVKIVLRLTLSIKYLWVIPDLLNI